MILIDTGPLVGLLDKSDANHIACTEALYDLAAASLVTTWPCFTEAMYLLGRDGGYSMQRHLWNLLLSKKIVLWQFEEAECVRMSALMAKYHDTPMDLADASLITAAESLGLRTIFTLDSDFRLYRLGDGSALEIIPR